MFRRKKKKKTYFEVDVSSRSMLHEKKKKRQCLSKLTITTKTTLQ